MKLEAECIRHKLPDTYMLIDQEARNVFASEITNGIIKSTIGFTHYSIRDNIINLQQKTALCLRCVAIKM